LLTKGLYIVPEQRTTTIKARSNRIGDIYNFAETTDFPFILISFIINKEFSEAKYELNDGQPDLRLHPIHEFSKWYGASMKRKSLISKWNQNKKTRYSVFENQLCNYLNAYRGFHIKRNQHKKYRNEFVHHIATLIRPKDVVLVGI
jgi:GntR family transcriptional regulator/MocR family aminotransferase